MKKVLAMLPLLGLLVLGGVVYSRGGGREAAKKLEEGNGRFVSGRRADKDLGEARRKELTKGQHPFATVLTCSDSRVVPEYLFDQGLGDLFVIRVAGNVVDEIALGSIEYGVEHLHTPVLVILGHQGCGAVTAALHAEGHGEGGIGAILEKIRPAVERARGAGLKSDGETLDLAIRENVRNVRRDVLARSAVVRKLVAEGRLEVILAVYRLDTGEVAPVAAEEERLPEGGDEGEF